MKKSILFIWAPTTFLALAYYYIFVVSKKPKIYSGNRALVQFLRDHVNTLRTKFYPHLLLWEGRLQTIFSMDSRPNNKLIYDSREIFALSDGGEIALDYLEGVQRDPNDQRVIVLLFPGITSSSQTAFVKSQVKAISNAGGSVIVFNNRGLGGVRLKTPNLFSATDYQDMRQVINHIRRNNPNDRIIACAYSMGGMCLAQYLTAYPEEAKLNLDAALVISTVWDAEQGTASLNKNSINRRYISKGIAQALVSIVSKNRHVLEESPKWDIDQVLKCQYLDEYDERFMTPQSGYPTVEEYYKAANLSGKIFKFSIPVFAFNALDDPMSPYMPISEANLLGSNLVLITTNRGGHLGFIEGIFRRSKEFHYVERFVHDFILAFKEFGSDLDTTIGSSSKL